MDELTAKLHLSNLLEAEGNSGQMELVCRTALEWLRDLHAAEARIEQLNDELRAQKQAMFLFIAGATA